MNQADIVHLTFKPPFIRGSYNRLVGDLLNKLPELRQAAICFWDEPLPEGVEADSRVILVDEENLSWKQRATLLTPERIRGRWFNGVTTRQSLVYLWGVIQAITQIQPKLIICHDNYKFGMLLRKHIGWPCRLALTQHGLSYHLPVAQAMQLYSLKSFDTVWTMTRTSYRFDRNRMAAYEPVVHLLPSMVDVNLFRPANDLERREARAQWGLAEDKLIVLSLSRLVAQKGAHILLQSWPEVLRHCPNAFFWIVGDGNVEYERYLKSLITSLNLSDSVRLQGAAQPEVIFSCYRAADVFAFPTLVSEGQSFALLEAMASGLACIASYQDSMADSFSPEMLHLVQDANISGSFVAPITSLLNDQAGRDQMGQKARQHVVQNHSMEKLLPRFEQVFRQQLKLAGEIH